MKNRWWLVLVALVALSAPYALAQEERLDEMVEQIEDTLEDGDERSSFLEGVEAYIEAHSEAEFSHGICDECAHKLYPELFGDYEIGLTRE